MSANKADDEKRGPGRPRKYPLHNPKPRHGLVNQPSDPNNYVEVLYDNPLMFKKIMQYFKSMAVDKVHIAFTKSLAKSRMYMWCQDHHNNTKIRVEIFCERMNHYFCKNDEMHIGLISSSLELVTRSIDKSCTSIYFSSSKDTYQQYLMVSFMYECGSRTDHKIQLIGEYSSISNTPQFDKTDEYLIKLELDSRKFKKMITDIKSLSAFIDLRQDGPDEPLLFEYTSEDHKIRSATVIRNSKNIKFESRIRENETFHIQFGLDYVKPISANLLSDEISIYAHENMPLMFVCRMNDGDIIVTVLTEVINES